MTILKQILRGSDISAPGIQGQHIQILRNMICCNQKPGGPKYGRLKVTLPNGQKNVLLAHRFAYMPNLPVDLHVSHKCHGFLCIELMHYKHEGYADCILE